MIIALKHLAAIQPELTTGGYNDVSTYIYAT